jgi:hypothetical protein
MYAVADAGLAFFEQPVHADDIDGMAAVTAASGTIAIGAEKASMLEDIRRHHARAARGVSLKTIKLGGLRGDGGGRLCDRLGLNVNVSAKTSNRALPARRRRHRCCTAAIAWG